MLEIRGVGGLGLILRLLRLRSASALLPSYLARRIECHSACVKRKKHEYGRLVAACSSAEAVSEVLGLEYCVHLCLV